jgi:hypothetical protein
VLQAVFESIRNDNDNDDSTRIVNGSVTPTRTLNVSNDPTVTAGDYHLSKVQLGAGESVTFDVKDGDVRVVVDGDVSLDRASIDVVNTTGNDNRVQIFVRSDTVAFDRSAVQVEGDDSTAMWFYSGAGTAIDVHESDVTGVLYAPGTTETPGSASITTDSSVSGAIVSGDTTIQAQSAVHHDKALTDSAVFSKQAHKDLMSAQVSYFHISYTAIEVDIG